MKFNEDNIVSIEDGAFYIECTNNQKLHIEKRYGDVGMWGQKIQVLSLTLDEAQKLINVISLLNHRKETLKTMSRKSAKKQSEKEIKKLQEFTEYPEEECDELDDQY